MNIIIKLDCLLKAIQHGYANIEKEQVGMFLGKKDSWTLEQFIPMRNISTSSTVHYEPHPDDLYKVLSQTTHFHKDALWDLVGTFHTHPHSEPIPSIVDILGTSYGSKKEIDPKDVGYEGIYTIFSPSLAKISFQYYDGENFGFNPVDVEIKIR